MSNSLWCHGLWLPSLPNHGISSPECWSLLPFPSPGYLPSPVSNLGLLLCMQNFYHLSYKGSMIFPVVMCRFETSTIQKVECQRIEIWYSRLLRAPWTARSNKSVLKEINPEYSLEELMLNLKLQYHALDVKSWLIGKCPDAGKDWGQKEKGVTEDKTVVWHH